MLNDNAEKPKQIDYLIQIAISLLADAKDQLSSYTDKEFIRDVATIKKRGHNEGITFFTSTITKLSQGLLNYLETNSSDYPNFAKKDTFEYPAFLSGIFKLAYDVGVEHSKAVGFIYQFGSTFKKLRGDYSADTLQKQIEEFVQVDTCLTELDNSNEADQLILEHARACITSIFRGITEEDFRSKVIPFPGPGATNTKVAHVERFRPNCIFEQLDRVFPYCEWFYATYNEWAWDIPRFRMLWLAKKTATTARYIIVPKYHNKPRGICIEENEMQFLQQGVKTFLYRHLERNKMTKGKINFSDQGVNQNLAFASSLTRQHATIDMKDASDRIPLKLVEELFRDVPFLRDAIVALSTRTVIFPDGKHVELHKYAPMGSGLCFPIMSIIHYALIRSILYISMQHDDSLDQIYVYGDDIVIPSLCVKAVFDWLPRFGMKINETKSYHSSYFRESCGVHAYNGMDVTPVYFKYTPEAFGSHEALFSLISNEALLYTKGYYRTSALIRSFKTLPYVGYGSSALGWKRPREYVMRNLNLTTYKSRWNEKLQRSEYHLTTLMSVGDGLMHGRENDMLLKCYLHSSRWHNGTWARHYFKKRRVWLSLPDLCQ